MLRQEFKELKTKLPTLWTNNISKSRKDLKDDKNI